MAMRSQSFYSAMSKYYGAVGKKPFVVKPKYPDFIDGKDCVKKMDSAKFYRFKKVEERTQKIERIINVLLILNCLIFIIFVPEGYFSFFLLTHCIILASGVMNKTVLQKRREKKIYNAFCFKL